MHCVTGLAGAEIDRALSGFAADIRPMGDEAKSYRNMALNPADIAVVSRLLDEALALDVAEREPWLAALAPEHQRHAEALRGMLAQEARLDTDPRLASLPKLASDETVAHADDRIGPYRLLREIGRGGMGSVWLAERADGAYKRQVALKLPRLAWGAGLAERMAREREIGMLLEHPNIARLYDAGVDERGRPFLALEYVDGQPIDAWCEAQGLSVRERLRLFVQVAKAVAYAHGRLVVHRDLKPSNVLVTPDGQAHLLDFGIAKLLDEALSGEPGLTQDGARVLTPDHAAPEQLSGGAITVQTDVYGLGALGYELLTRRRPLEEVQEMAQKRAQKRAQERAQERAQHVPGGDTEPALASTRAPNPATARVLRGEIDAILAKAIKHEPRDRYATADALADDIERYLAGERVLARPDRLGYRLRKTLRRHRTAFVAAATVFVALLGSTTVVALQAQKASAEARRAGIVKAFVIEVFKVNERGNPINPELRSLPAELLLERGARLVETRFAGQPDLQAELYGVVAQILLDMGAAKSAVDFASRQVQAQQAAGASATERAQGLLLLGEALTAVRQLREAQHHATGALALAASDPSLRLRAHLLMADAMIQDHRPSQALTEIDSADAVLASAPAQASLKHARATFLRASALAELGRDSLAQPLLRTSIAQAEAEEPAPSRLAARIRIRLATSLVVALSEHEVERIRRQGAGAVPTAAEALQLNETAFAALRAAGGPDAVEGAVAQAYATWLYAGNAMIGYDQADRAFADSLSVIDQLGARLPKTVRARILFYRGCAAQNAGRAEAGYTLMAESVALRLVDNPGYTPGGCLGHAARDSGRHEEAQKILHRIVALEAKDPAAAQVSMVLALARNSMMQGHLRSAQEILRELRASKARAGAPLVPDSVDGSAVTTTEAWIDLERKDPAAAERRLQGLPSSGHAIAFDAELLRGAAACGLGRSQDGLVLLRARIQHHETRVLADNPYLAYWHARAGQCALVAGQQVQAVEWAGKARLALKAQPALSPFFKSPVFKLEQALGLKLPPV